MGEPRTFYVVDSNISWSFRAHASYCKRTDSHCRKAESTGTAAWRREAGETVWACPIVKTQLVGRWCVFFWSVVPGQVRWKVGGSTRFGSEASWFGRSVARTDDTVTAALYLLTFCFVSFWQSGVLVSTVGSCPAAWIQEKQTHQRPRYSVSTEHFQLKELMLLFIYPCAVWALIPTL